MTRSLISSAIPADFLHGDEGQGVYSAEEETFLDHGTQGLLADRLNDYTRFSDLMDGLDRAEIEPHLHRALQNLDRAIKGETDGKYAIFAALSEIQARLRIEAQAVWADECREEAERQLREEFA